jgi:hypothetical protein
MLAMKGTIGKNMPPEFNEFILRAMEEYAKESSSIILDAYIKEQNKAHRRLIFALFGMFGKGTWENFILHYRTWNLKRIKKVYQKISNEDHRKYYIIRSTEIGYVSLSTADVDRNKRTRVFGKHVDAKELTKTADCVILPKYH